MDGKRGPLRGCPALTPRSFVTAEPTLRPRRSGCSPSTGKLQLNSHDPFSIPSEPSHVQSLPLPSPSTAWATHTSNRDPWRRGRGADVWRERAMGQGEPQGLNPGAWWSPLESRLLSPPAPPLWQSATNPLNKEGVQWTHCSPWAAEEPDPMGALCGESVTGGDAGLWSVSSTSLRYPEILTFGLLHTVLWGSLGHAAAVSPPFHSSLTNDSSANQSQHGLTHAFSCPSIYSTNDTGPFHLAQCQALQQSQNWKGQSTNYSIYGLGCWVRRK